jgi:hypothetical protein
MKVFVHFCIYVEHDSVNFYSSEKFLEQDLYKKIRTHFLPYTHFQTLQVGKKNTVNIPLCHAMCTFFIYIFKIVSSVNLSADCLI